MELVQNVCQPTSQGQIGSNLGSLNVTLVSAYGIGAVISQLFSEGSKSPTAYTSNNLSKSEHNEAQLEKEALSIDICSNMDLDSFPYQPALVEVDLSGCVSIISCNDATPTVYLSQQREKMADLRHSYVIHLIYLDLGRFIR